MVQYMAQENNDNSRSEKFQRKFKNEEGWEGKKKIIQNWLNDKQSPFTQQELQLIFDSNESIIVTLKKTYDWNDRKRQKLDNQFLDNNGDDPQLLKQAEVLRVSNIELHQDIHELKQIRTNIMVTMASLLE